MLTPRDDDSPACPRCQDFIVQRDAAIADRDMWRHVAWDLRLRIRASDRERWRADTDRRAQRRQDLIEAMERPDGE